MLGPTIFPINTKLTGDPENNELVLSIFRVSIYQIYKQTTKTWKTAQMMCLGVTFKFGRY